MLIINLKVSRYKKWGEIMPRRDGTGPAGMGAMTGRGAGYCNKDARNIDFGRSFGGYGCQRGYRRQFVQTGVPGYLRDDAMQYEQGTDTKEFWETQEAGLKNRLQFVQERLAGMKKPAAPQE